MAILKIKKVYLELPTSVESWDLLDSMESDATWGDSPHLPTDAAVSKAHDGQGKDEDNQQHATLIHLAVDLVWPLLNAPVALLHYAYFLVHLMAIWNHHI